MGHWINASHGRSRSPATATNRPLLWSRISTQRQRPSPQIYYTTMCPTRYRTHSTCPYILHNRFWVRFYRRIFVLFLRDRLQRKSQIKPCQIFREFAHPFPCPFPEGQLVGPPHQYWEPWIFTTRAPFSEDIQSGAPQFENTRGG